MFKLVREPLYAHGPAEARFVLRWFAVSLILHFILAYFSVGFYHYDEHFQILEFGGLKAGYTRPSALPWEYGDQIRPTLQPFMVYATIKVLTFFHGHNPFIVATILRFISASLGWVATCLVALAALQWFPARWIRRSFIVFSAILGSLIFVHVRFSSESWSGSFAFIAIALILLLLKQMQSTKDVKAGRIFFLAGLLLGLSYVCRFQSAFLLPGIFLWLLIIARVSFRSLLLASAGVVAAIGIGLVLDRWFYGQWVNTAFNYFQKNIVEGKAAEFGVAPWYWYFSELLGFDSIALQIPMILLVLISFYTARKNLIVWACVPFLAAHFLVGHKELRFLFPIIGALPVLIALGVQSLHLEHINELIRKRTQTVVLSLGAIFVFSNMGSYFTLCRDQKHAYIDALHAIYLNHEEPVDVVLNDKMAYSILAGKLKVNFYKRPNLNFIYVQNRDSVKTLIEHDPKTVLLMVSNKGFQLGDDFKASRQYFEPEYYQMPLWMKLFNINNWVGRTSFWQVHRARK